MSATTGQTPRNLDEEIFGKPASGAAAPASGDLLAKADPALWSTPFGWSKQTRPLAGLNSLLKGALYVYMVIQAINIASVLIMMASFWFLSAETAVPDPLASALDVVGSFSTFLPFALIGGLLICAVCYLRFVYRAMNNLHLSKARGLTISPGWAVGWSFVPFANLGMIPKVMLEIWRGSKSPDRLLSGIPPLFFWWWSFYLVGNIVGRTSDSMVPEDAAFEDLPGLFNAFAPSAITALVSSSLAIVACFFLQAITRQITDSQELLRSTSAFE